MTEPREDAPGFDPEPSRMWGKVLADPRLDDEDFDIQWRVRDFVQSYGTIADPVAAEVVERLRREPLTEHLKDKHNQKTHGRSALARDPGQGNEDGTGESFNARLGRCYELSGRYAMDHEDAVLVHGSIQGYDNPRIGHGWCERGGKVYEPISNKMWHPVVFKALFNPIEDQKYDAVEWRKKVLQTRHWGPWGESSGALKPLKGGKR